ncbi:MAG: fructose-6-phosphate aldolase [Bacteroidia bacterium]|nr:fructose-6-phosphate aldolase [Bacteroidia bacterium]
MKFFLDTANLDEIRTAQALGVLDGVTTNPSLMAKEGVRDFEGHYKAICEICEGGDVSAEVIATDFKGIVKEGKALAKLHDSIVVKIPMIVEGVKAIKALADEGIRINTTLIFSSPQALIAAKAGAAYVSPFVGRLDDIGHDGMELIEEIRTIFDNYALPTEILAASIRHPQHIVQAALSGADVATLPYKVLESLFKHPLTDRGLDQFLADHAALMATLGEKPAGKGKKG